MEKVSMKAMVVTVVIVGLLCVAMAHTVVAAPRDQVTITIKVVEDGRAQTFRKVVPGSDLRAVVLGTRTLLVDTFAALPPPPEAYIFQCGGDFEQSDGSCADVILACIILGLEFECNKYDEEWVCTNGGC
jgi:hypothetical protein